MVTQDFIIVNEFDEYCKEILEEIKVSKPTKKMKAVVRIPFITEKNIYALPANDRFIYCEYKGNYTDILQKLKPDA